MKDAKFFKKGHGKTSRASRTTPERSELSYLEYQGSKPVLFLMLKLVYFKKT